MNNEPEFEDIQRALSAPNDSSPWGLTRRRFLQMSAAGVTVATVGPMVGKYEALAGPRLAHDEGVVVMIQLGGGNDGINTLIPFMQEGRYRDLRGNLAYDSDEVHHIGKRLLRQGEVRRIRDQIALSGSDPVRLHECNLFCGKRAARWA